MAKPWTLSKVLTGAMLFAGFAHPRLCAATTYDVQSDFSATANPNGPWQYGSAASLNGPISLLNTRLYPSNGALVQLRGSSDVPNIHANLTGLPVFDTLLYAPHVVTLHPGSSGRYCVIDWVVPQQGEVSLTGRFEGLHNTTTDVVVLVKGVQQFFGQIRGLGDLKAFALPGPFHVTGGERIRFAVGPGANQQFEQDTTALDVQVSFSPVPEPSAFIVAGGLVASAAVGRNCIRGRRCSGSIKRTTQLTYHQPR
jgi:hypothetical protein